MWLKKTSFFFTLFILLKLLGSDLFFEKLICYTRSCCTNHTLYFVWQCKKCNIYYLSVFIQRTNNSSRSSPVISESPVFIITEADLSGRYIVFGVILRASAGAGKRNDRAKLMARTRGEFLIDELQLKKIYSITIPYRISGKERWNIFYPLSFQSSRDIR